MAKARRKKGGRAKPLATKAGVTVNRRKVH